MRDEKDNIEQEDVNQEENQQELENAVDSKGDADDSSEKIEEKDVSSDDHDDKEDELSGLSTEELKETIRKQREENEKQRRKITSDRKKLRNINMSSQLDPVEMKIAQAMDSAETNAEKMELENQLRIHRHAKDYAKEIDAQGRQMHSDWDETMAKAANLSPGAAQYLLSIGDPQKIYEAAKIAIGDEYTPAKQEEQKPKVIYKKIANKPVKDLVDSPNISRSLSQNEKIARLKKIKGL